jgi:hypothetical protein
MTTPSPLSIQDVVDMDISDKKIFIVGKPASGKTFLLHKLPKGNGSAIDTDDYFGYYGLLKTSVSLGFKPTIVAGMACYDLLLDSLDEPRLFPDIIIQLEISRGQQEKIYREQRDKSKIKYQIGFWNKHLAMWNKYLSSIEGKENKPQIITVNNVWS